MTTLFWTWRPTTTDRYLGTDDKQDMAFERMTVDDFQAPLRPKVHGSLNLHNLFQDVDFFIMLSSLGGVVGTAGQANYAAGNVFQDALANFRRAQGLHAVAIDLGMVEAVGHVAQNTQGIAERLERAGLASLTEMDMLRIVEWAIQQPSAPAQITTCIGTGQGAGWEKSPWGQEARFADLRYRKAIQSQAEAPTKDEGRLRDQLTSGSVEVGAAEVICRGLVKKIAGMFGLVEEDVSPAKSLADYGVDSLVAVEMRNWIISQVGADISIFELMQSPSLAELSTKLAAVWKK
jgi:aryl carrier-like protein